MIEKFQLGVDARVAVAVAAGGRRVNCGLPGDNEMIV